MRKLLLAFLAVALTGCAGFTLDTTNKRFAAFEVSYKSVLVEVDQLQKADALKPETKAGVREVLGEVEKARAGAYIAKGTGNITEAQSQLTLALALLDNLRANLPKGAKL